jgi:ABC-type Fe3+/spermidine/putrescine transport system ATPase subunit
VVASGSATMTPPGRRPTSGASVYVFQRASMFPHYTVRENIGWGLKLRGCRRQR